MTRACLPPHKEHTKFTLATNPKKRFSIEPFKIIFKPLLLGPKAGQKNYPSQCTFFRKSRPIWGAGYLQRDLLGLFVNPVKAKDLWPFRARNGVFVLLAADGE